jgi:hypothetical protein
MSRDGGFPPFGNFLFPPTENAMKRFLHWFGSGRASNSGPRPFRPHLEQLDDRLLPSTMSSAIAIPHGGGIVERDWYTVDQATGKAVEVVDATRYPLGGPGNIVALSASVDPITGYGEVFALSTFKSQQLNFDAHLWLCNSDGFWSYFGGDYKGISATRDGHVYAVTHDGAHVWYLNSDGNGFDLGAPNSGSGPWAGPSLAASHGFFGGNEVFAIGANFAIYVNSSSGRAGNSGWRLVDNSAKFGYLSASSNGPSTVFARTWDPFAQGNKLYQETEHIVPGTFNLYWTHEDISAGRLYGDISADTDAEGNPEIYAIDVTGLVLLYDKGSWTAKTEPGSSYYITGADAGYFFDVYYQNGQLHAWEYDPSWPGWYDLGFGLE